MFLLALLLLQPPATPATFVVQEQIDRLTTEREQLIALQFDCTPAARTAAQASHQAIIDKLVALKAEPQATADIDVLLDLLIARFQDSLKNFDTITPDRPCTREKGATVRLAEIAAQLAKLEVLKGR